MRDRVSDDRAMDGVQRERTGQARCAHPPVPFTPAKGSRVETSGPPHRRARRTATIRSKIDDASGSPDRLSIRAGQDQAAHRTAGAGTSTA